MGCGCKIAEGSPVGAWVDHSDCRIADLTAQLEAAKRENTCTCGSGGHPRRCAAHPQGYDLHVLTLNYENAQNEISTLTASLAEVTKDLEAFKDLAGQRERSEADAWSKYREEKATRRDLEAERDALTAKVSSLEQHNAVLVDAVKAAAHLIGEVRFVDADLDAAEETLAQLNAALNWKE